MTEIYDLYRVKYGEPESGPLRLGPSQEERESWRSYCARAVEGTPTEEDRMLEAFGGGHRFDCDANPEPRPSQTVPVRWRDGDRVITLTASGLWRGPEADYTGFDSVTVEYTTQAHLDSEAEQTRANQEATEGDHERSRTERGSRALDAI